MLHIITINHCSKMRSYKSLLDLKHALPYLNHLTTTELAHSAQPTICEWINVLVVLFGTYVIFTVANFFLLTLFWNGRFISDTMYIWYILGGYVFGGIGISMISVLVRIVYFSSLSETWKIAKYIALVEFITAITIILESCICHPIGMMILSATNSYSIEVGSCNILNNTFCMNISILTFGIGAGVMFVLICITIGIYKCIRLCTNRQMLSTEV